MVDLWVAQWVLLMEKTKADSKGATLVGMMDKSWASLKVDWWVATWVARKDISTVATMAGLWVESMVVKTARL